jgi:glycosyltransferase involved in cell wall biosynthesis
MHLLVVSDTSHYERDGQIVGWGPAVQEISWLARAFDQVTHLACLRRGPAPESFTPYDAGLASRIRFVFLPRAGGLSVREKSRVILYGPGYARAILKALPEADVVHIRCPSSLGMYGMVLVSLFGRAKRWSKYGGNWGEQGLGPLSFAFQRWWLGKGLTRGPVTMNGRWPDQPDFCFTFDNPSLTLGDIRSARVSAREKTLEKPIRLIFVGRVVAAKGMGVLLEIVRQLLLDDPDVPSLQLSLDILGDGHERAHFERLSKEMGLGGVVRFHGWVSQGRVHDFLARSHLLLLPSQTEGWPKVLSEAMAYGVVPITSQVSDIPRTLADVGTGVALPPNDVQGYVRAIRAIIQDPSGWQQSVRAGLGAASRFTYERYLVRLDEMFKTFYGSSPFDHRVLAPIRRELGLAASHTEVDGGKR